MNFTPKDPNFAARVKDSFERQKFMALLKAILVKTEPGFCEIHIPYNDSLTQQHSFIHGGVVGTIADTTSGYAAFSLMDASSSILSVEFKLNLIAPAKGDLLIGRASVLKNGKILTICRAEVFIVTDGKEKLCAASQSTLIELNNKNDF
jgi:uncharacterized protein (TIGR00369 family)